jgi:hypothetical protein
MKALLALILATSFLAFGQEDVDVDTEPSQTLPVLRKELKAAIKSDYVNTFAEAFTDPNVLMGVFENPKYIPNSVSNFSVLSSDDILELKPGYFEALNQFDALRKLKCIKSIKGQFVESFVILICPPFMQVSYETHIPIFTPLTESKWVLALKKTTHEYRVTRLGEEVKKYTFLNDDTVFSLFHWGHGTLCLQWPEKEMKPENMVQVSQDIIPDLQAIGQALPHMQKKTLEAEDLTALNNTKNALKTPQAKAIFEKMLQKRSNPE